MSLARRSSGPEVKLVQEQLKVLGFYKYAIDGDYGAGTMAAVRSFQQQYMVDGIVNEITSELLLGAVEAWKENPDKLWFPPSGYQEIVRDFGRIEYTNTHDGRIEITNDWEEQYLVKHNFPVIGDHHVNKAIVGVLSDILLMIEDRGLDRLIKQFWCFTPRHKMWDSKRGLSTHSWGVAVDINWATNGVGKVGDMDPGIIAAFEMHGWEWGGRWRCLDSMHFQGCTNW